MGPPRVVRIVLGALLAIAADLPPQVYLYGVLIEYGYEANLPLTAR